MWLRPLFVSIDKQSKRYQKIPNGLGLFGYPEAGRDLRHRSEQVFSEGQLAAELQDEQNPVRERWLVFNMMVWWKSSRALDTGGLCHHRR